MTVVPATAFETGVLSSKHERLVLDIDHYADRAGITPTHIWTSAKTSLSEPDVKYLTKCLKLAQEGIPGAVYEGTKDYTEQMALMAGALIRAFVDARVMTVAQVLEAIDDGDHPEATVLFIPNFFSLHEFSKYDMKKAAALGDLLTHRAMRHEPTVIKVDSINDMFSRFGAHAVGLIEKMVHQEL